MTRLLNRIGANATQGFRRRAAEVTPDITQLRMTGEYVYIVILSVDWYIALCLLQNTTAPDGSVLKVHDARSSVAPHRARPSGIIYGDGIL
jgi:hypothetical protein